MPKIILNDKDIENFIEYPEYFGHWLGYDKLIDMHGYWIKEAHIYNNVQALMAHRKSYKTTAIIVVGFIWYLMFFDPNATMLYLRKTDDEAVAICAVIRENFEKPETIAIANYLYGVNSLETKVWSNSKMKISIKTNTTPEGSVEARGLGGARQGTHHSKIFADDFINLKDRTSEAERKSTLNYISDLTNIVTDEGRIFYSGTPWHKEDAWSKLPKPLMFPMGTVPIPGYRTKEELDAKRKELHESALTSSLIAANYDLKHIADEGHIFNNPKYSDWPTIPLLRVNAYCDPAYKGTNTTALTLIAETIEHTFHGRGWVWRKDIEEMYQPIVDLLKLWKCGTMGVESNADKGYSARDFMKLWPATIEVNESTNKHVKILANLKAQWHNIYWANDCQPEYMNQILDYQEGQEPDDGSDSAASLIRMMGIGGGTGLYELLGGRG
jgi:hypothetical protein